VIAVGGPVPASAARDPRRAPASAAFSMGEAAAAERPEAPGGVAPSGLLALQEADAEPVQDRAARRRGERLLEELAAFQRALLGGFSGAPQLARLAALAVDVPTAAAPGLRAAMDQLVLRVNIELARREMMR
jgi:hypothetical protein